MIKLTTKQEYLLLGKLSNTLTEEEVKEWDQLMDQIPEVAARYKALINKLPEEDIASGFSYLDHPDYWDNLANSFDRKPHIKARRLPLRIRPWTWAAIFAGILVLSALVWNQIQKKTKRVTSLTSGVELLLADGSTINLSQQQGSIKTNTASLHNTHKTLSYTGGGTKATAINTLSVPVGLDYKIILADGTEVWMNSATELKFPMVFGVKNREITLNGEAYLKVAKDPNRAFIVHLPNSNVRVLGTEFNVNTYDSGVVIVSLIKGAVNLQTPESNLKIAPGKQAIYKNGQPVRQGSFDPKFVLGWQQGLFYFDKATLKEISKVISRWYGIQVFIDNPKIEDKTFAGVLDRNQPVSVFQADLKLISNIDSYVDQNNMLHFK